MSAKRRQPEQPAPTAKRVAPDVSEDQDLLDIDIPDAANRPGGDQGAEDEKADEQKQEFPEWRPDPPAPASTDPNDMLRGDAHYAGRLFEHEDTVIFGIEKYIDNKGNEVVSVRMDYNDEEAMPFYRGLPVRLPFMRLTHPHIWPMGNWRRLNPRLQYGSDTLEGARYGGAISIVAWDRDRAHARDPTYDAEAKTVCGHLLTLFDKFKDFMWENRDTVGARLWNQFCTDYCEELGSKSNSGVALTPDEQAFLADYTVTPAYERSVKALFKIRMFQPLVKLKEADDGQGRKIRVKGSEHLTFGGSVFRKMTPSRKAMFDNQTVVHPTELHKNMWDRGYEFVDVRMYDSNGPVPFNRRRVKDGDICSLMLSITPYTYLNPTKKAGFSLRVEDVIYFKSTRAETAEQSAMSYDFGSLRAAGAAEFSDAHDNAALLHNLVSAEAPTTGDPAMVLFDQRRSDQ